MSFGYSNTHFKFKKKAVIKGIVELYDYTINYSSESMPWMRNALNAICMKSEQKTKEDVISLLEVMEQSIALGNRLHEEMVTIKFKDLFFKNLIFVCRMQEARKS